MPWLPSGPVHCSDAVLVQRAGLDVPGHGRRKCAVALQCAAGQPCEGSAGRFGTGHRGWQGSFAPSLGLLCHHQAEGCCPRIDEVQLLWLESPALACWLITRFRRHACT